MSCKKKYIDNILSKEKTPRKSIASTFFEDDSIFNISVPTSKKNTDSDSILSSDDSLSLVQNNQRNRNKKKTDTPLMRTTLSYKRNNIPDNSVHSTDKLQFVKSEIIGIKPQNKINLFSNSLPTYLDYDCKLTDIIVCDHNRDDDEISHRLNILQDNIDKLNEKYEKLIDQNNNILSLLIKMNERMDEQEDIYLTSSFYSHSSKL